MSKRVLLLIPALLVAGCAVDGPAATTTSAPATSAPASSTRPSAPASTRAASTTPSGAVTVSTQAPLSPSTGAAGAGGTTTCSYPAAGKPAKPADPPPTSDVSKSGTATFTVTMNEGDLVLTLDRAATPCTVNSFEALAKQRYFDDTQCHRLVDQGIFVLQCGDPTGTGTGGPGYRFGDELTGKEKYPAGTIAMANAGPNTNGSQFFIVYADSQLPPKYTVFGKVDEKGLGVVNRIAAMGHTGSPGDGKPINEARIKTVVAG